MDAKSEIQYFWERRDHPIARSELRIALEHEKKKRKADAKKKALVSRSYKLESLLGTSGWDELTAMLQEQEELFWKRHVAAVKRGEEIDQRQLDRAMGKLDGIRAILSAPGEAAAILLREQTGDEAA